MERQVRRLDTALAKQTVAVCDVSYGDVSASTRAVSWPDGGAYVRDEVAEHVRDFSPEIAMSDRCIRSESALGIPNNEQDTHGMRSAPVAPYVE